MPHTQHSSTGETGGHKTTAAKQRSDREVTRAVTHEPARKRKVATGKREFQLAAKGTIARTIQSMLLRGKGASTPVILKTVKQKHRGCQTTPASVSFYRWQLRKVGALKRAG